jgi:hypothetical protein
MDFSCLVHRLWDFLPDDHPVYSRYIVAKGEIDTGIKASGIRT